MRKQLAIGASTLALTAWGGASENSVLTVKRGAYQQYTHLTNSSQSQIYEPMSRADFSLSLPNRLNFKPLRYHLSPVIKNLNLRIFILRTQPLTNAKGMVTVYHLVRPVVMRQVFVLIMALTLINVATININTTKMNVHILKP